MERYEYTKQALANGVSIRQIGKDLGVDYSTVTYWIKKNFSSGLRTKFVSQSDVLDICQTYPAHYAYMLGCYLGDGHIIKSPRTYKLTIYNSEIHPEIISDQILSLKKLFPTNKINNYKQLHNKCVEVRVHNLSLPYYFPQHGPGKKHNRPIIFEDWQQEIVTNEPECFLKGLIDTDGTEYLTSGKYRRYSFCNVSQNIIELYKTTMKQLNIHYTIVNRKANKSRNIITRITTSPLKDVQAIDKAYEIAESKLHT